MKEYPIVRKHFVALIAALAFVLLASSCANSSQRSAASYISPQDSEPTVAPAIGSRTLDSFRFIGPTTTMQEVYAAVGHEDRVIGSGLTIYEYRLSDGSYIWIGTTSSSHIIYVRHGKKLDGSETLHPKQ